MTRSTTELREMVIIPLFDKIYDAKTTYVAVPQTSLAPCSLRFELPKMHLLFLLTALQWHLSTPATLLCILCGWTGIPWTSCIETLFKIYTEYRFFFLRRPYTLSDCISVILLYSTLPCPHACHGLLHNTFGTASSDTHAWYIAITSTPPSVSSPPANS